MTRRSIAVAVLVSTMIVAIALVAMLALDVSFSDERKESVIPELVGCYGEPGNILVSIGPRYVTVYPSGEKTLYVPIMNSDGISALPERKVSMVEDPNIAAITTGIPTKLRLGNSGSELVVIVAGNNARVAHLAKYTCTAGASSGRSFFSGSS